MPVGSGTNSNMNGIRIESRVLAPPGGFSSISFGGEQSNEDKFKGHNFNPKSQKTVQEQESEKERQSILQKQMNQNQHEQRDETEEENYQPAQRNVSRGHGAGGGASSGIPGLETSNYPVKTSVPSNPTVTQQQFPGRRGRGGGESTFSLGWE